MSIENRGSEGYENWKATEELSVENRTAKQKRWAELEAEVDEIVDGLDHPIDKGIRSSVIALKAHEFPTYQSCEGHINNEEHGEKFPWVWIAVPEPEGVDGDEQKEKEWTLENLKLQKKMMDLMNEFYKNRKTDFDSRLSFKPNGIYGAFTIKSMGAEVMELYSGNELMEKQQAYRKELAEFAEFLKDKFLDE